MSKHAIELNPGWSRMTMLTSLTIQARMSTCVSLASLPALQSLDLHFVPFPQVQREIQEMQEGSASVAELLLPGSLTRLTRLAIRSPGDFCQEDLETLLPAAALHQLKSLVDFKLALYCNMFLMHGEEGTFLDLHVLNCMPQLTKLDLSCNDMPCLPPALSSLTVLQELDVHANEGLEISPGCVSILKSMHTLKLLVIDQRVWSKAVRALQTIDLILPTTMMRWMVKRSMQS